MTQAKKDAYNKFKLSENNVKAPYKALAAIFQCQICKLIIDNIVKCKECEKVFCADCLNSEEYEGLFGSAERKCQACDKPLIDSTEKRLVKELLNKVKFNCAECDEDFIFENRAKHVHKVSIDACPFGCQDFAPCHPDELEKHVKEECTSDALKCQDCEYEIYKIYTEGDLVIKKGGHNCGRDLYEEFNEAF